MAADLERSSSNKADVCQAENVKDAANVSEKYGETMERFAHLDEKKILRKLDLRIIPMLTLLYLLSYLDRGNIGNAKIEGLDVDLGLTPDQYNWCLTVFFFSYSAFEVPSNMVLKKLRPSVWLPCIMVAWGTVMTLMGLVKDYHGLLVARIFLGVTEAGLFPGVAFYLTMWYCRHEMQLRQALFFAAASVAGAFSGLLAFGIAKMDGVGGLAGWRWIFILEGIATVICAVFAFWGLYDYPETASFLSDDEREFVIYRLRYQGGMVGASSEDVETRVPEDQEFKWVYARQAFGGFQVWIMIIAYWAVVCPIFGISLSLPTIIRDLGYQRQTAQLMTVPIYIVASIFGVVIAYFSDRVKLRSPFSIGCLTLTVVGLTMCLASTNRHVLYAALFLAAMGMYAASSGVITWLAVNLSGSCKRSIGMAIQISVGNLGGAMASNFYRAKDAPRYILGHSLSLGFVIAGILSMVSLLVTYNVINRKRERALREGKRAEYSEEQLSFLGDKAITWRYMY
ncbi:unnamed protein product [Clonostachys solani]|uniref:Major facilitator superfamily (MFS) profile domain-containing protein n=1 Tax=Clonostachys solani TaxID=160281 RepID=A0A9P0ENC4_9HYPO|nr:unnamed protein product [Clonostachys solani]